MTVTGRMLKMKIKRVDLEKSTVKIVLLAALTFLVSLPVLAQDDVYPVPDTYQVEDPTD